MTLLKKIKKNNEIIGVFGLGYIGLPTAINFSKKKIKVYGFDTDKSKVNKLNKSQSYISSIKSEDIKKAKKNGFIATGDYSNVKKLDVIIICVPTPLTKNKIPDLRFINSTLSSLMPFIKKQQLISLESTTYPGTTDEIILPLLKKKKFIVGKDVYLSFSPERIDPAIRNISIKDIPKITSGVTQNCLKVSSMVYAKIHKRIVKVSNTKAAETTKLLENVFRAVNIGLVNELKIFTDKLGLNIHEIIEAAATKPFGFMPFYPGPGLGGHCIPIDPYYLSWKAKQLGINTQFIKLAGEINSSIPLKIVNKIIKIFKKKIPQTNKKILILGVAYKKNVNDLRESPGIKIIDLLKKKNFKVSYSDPYIPKLPKLRNYQLNLNSIKINARVLKTFDLVIIAADHDRFDYNLVYKFSNLILDTRNVYKFDDRNKVIKNFN